LKQHVAFTLGLALLRLIRCDGAIVFLGRPIEGLKFKAMRPLRHDMQIVFQDPYGSLSPRLPVGDIVAEGLGVQCKDMSLPRRREIVAQALADTGRDGSLSARIFRRPEATHRDRAGDCPGAEIHCPRRADLGPRHVGASAGRRSLVRFAKAARLAYLFISHDLKVVRALASEIIVMRDGKVVVRR
jgi:microcin C transport system ATP-binding protein